MSFAKRLASLRKANKMTQQQMAEVAGVHLSQIRRYESGDSQPTLEVLRNIAIALHISADTLVFDKDERGPQADDLKLTFEAINNFDPQERLIAKRVLQGLILQHQSKHLASLMQSDEDNLILTDQAS